MKRFVMGVAGVLVVLFLGLYAHVAFTYAFDHGRVPLWPYYLIDPIALILAAALAAWLLHPGLRVSATRVVLVAALGFVAKHAVEHVGPWALSAWVTPPVGGSLAVAILLTQSLATAVAVAALALAVPRIDAASTSR